MRVKKILSIVFALALFVCIVSAEADESILGRSFPDFSATDTEGHTFSLSEALDQYEAVLINIWASWCPPCESEFPLLNEVYQQYRDRVAFIALSCEVDDTIDIIREYRSAHGISFPMGRDEGMILSEYIGAAGIPDTVIIDRFGNTCFMRVGMFTNPDELRRTIEAFLGDGYTESKILNGIPPEDSTVAFPLSDSRAIHVNNENVKKVYFYHTSSPEPITAYIVNDDTAHVSLKIAVSDDPAGMVFYDDLTKEIRKLSALLDPEKHLYTVDVPMNDESVCYVCLVDYNLVTATNDDPEGIDVYLLKNEDAVQQFADMIRDSFNEETTWKYADESQSESDSAQRYIIHIVDQYGAPIPDVMINFCTDQSCVPCESDQTGTVAFAGKPDRYHVRLIDVPDGYSYDEAFEMYTNEVYGEWSLRIRKD